MHSIAKIRILNPHSAFNYKNILIGKDLFVFAIGGGWLAGSSATAAASSGKRKIEYIRH